MNSLKQITRNAQLTARERAGIVIKGYKRSKQSEVSILAFAKAMAESGKSFTGMRVRSARYWIANVRGQLTLFAATRKGFRSCVIQERVR